MGLWAWHPVQITSLGAREEVWQPLQGAPRCGPREIGKDLSWSAGMSIPPSFALTAAAAGEARLVGSMNAGLHALATWHCEQSCGNGGDVAVPRWLG